MTSLQPVPRSTNIPSYRGPIPRSAQPDPASAGVPTLLPNEAKLGLGAPGKARNSVSEYLPSPRLNEGEYRQTNPNGCNRRSINGLQAIGGLSPRRKSQKKQAKIRANPYNSVHRSRR